VDADVSALRGMVNVASVTCPWGEARDQCGGDALIPRIIAGFACVSPSGASATPEFGIAIAHLRDVLGDQTYESLARKGETLTTAAVATYAYDQIDQARTELEHPS
jgi:hypothetical protein